MKKGEKQKNSSKANVPLGSFVKARRESKGLSRRQVADACGVDYSYIGKLESGEYRHPSPLVLDAIAREIGCKPTDLYVLAGYKIGGDLPGFGPYLRATTHLPPEAIDQLESYFAFLRSQYGIPEDQPVFPPKPRNDDTHARGDEHPGGRRAA